MDTKITITTGCYNSENFIERTFESIVSQNYPHIEWVVVNDSSSDNTLQILNAIAKRSPFPVKVINFEKNKGTVFSNATAVQEASGDFTILLDHDDELMPGSITRLLKIWAEKDTGNGFGVWGRCVNEKNELLGDPIPGLPLVCSYGYFFHVLKCRVECFCMFKTSILKKYFFDSAKQEGATNGLIWNRIGLEYEAIFTNEVFRKYYTDIPGSMTRQKKTRYPGLMANQEAEYLNTNNKFFWKDFFFFMKKIYVYLNYCHYAGTSIKRSIKNLNHTNLKIAASLLVPLLPIAMLKDRLT